MSDLKRPEDILLHLVQDGCTPTGRILGHARSLRDSVDAVRREAFKAGLLVAEKICADEEQRLYKRFGEDDGEHLGAEKCGDLIKDVDYDIIIAAQSAQEKDHG